MPWKDVISPLWAVNGADVIVMLSRLLFLYMCFAKPRSFNAFTKEMMKSEPIDQLSKQQINRQTDK